MVPPGRRGGIVACDEFGEGWAGKWGWGRGKRRRMRRRECERVIPAPTPSFPREEPQAYVGIQGARLFWMSSQRRLGSSQRAAGALFVPLHLMQPPSPPPPPAPQLILWRLPLRLRLAPAPLRWTALGARRGGNSFRVWPRAAKLSSQTPPRVSSRSRVAIRACGALVDALRAQGRPSQPPQKSPGGGWGRG
jgi:hypothetical protein